MPKIVASFGLKSILILLFAILIFVLSSSGKNVCKQVEVNILSKKSNLTFVTDEEVRAIIEQYYHRSPENLSLSELNIVDLENELLKHPFIKNADVYIDVLNNLNIRIEQKYPLLRVHNLKGQQFYFGEDAEPFPVSTKQSVRCLLASGNIYYNPEKEHYAPLTADVPIFNLFKIAEYIYKTPLLNALIEQIFVTKNQEIILIPKIGKQPINLGTAEDYAEKLTRLTTFYEKAMNNNNLSNFNKIDLRFKNQIVCTH